MAANQKVSITIDDSFTQPVCECSVGFLRFERYRNIENASPVGSGTFAKLGDVYGILTAGHVLQKFGEKEEIGLVRFPGVQPPLQNFRLNLALTDRDVMWSGNDCDAPDIAFLKIPALEGRDLEAAGAVFYNLELPREFVPTNPDHLMSKCHVIVGVVGEWTKKNPDPLDNAKKIDVGGLFGAVKDLREFSEDNVEIIEVEIDYAAGLRIPGSYGGVSGGGLWELYVELDKKLTPVDIKKQLSGVAFRQSCDKQRVTFNATPSIDAITKKIAARWPDG